jgi:hypothetical protein
MEGLEGLDGRLDREAGGEAGGEMEENKITALRVSQQRKAPTIKIQTSDL